MPAPKPLPPFKIIGNHIRLSSGADGTTWPWPFFPDYHDHPAHRARYSPERLTKEDAMYLAGVHDAYSTLITHPSRSVRETLHVLHRISETKVAQEHLERRRPCATPCCHLCGADP
jgi:hypothetical protein